MIAAFIAAKGYAPTVREIAKALGLRSTNGIDDHLCRLEQKGWICRVKDRVISRGILLVDTQPPSAPRDDRTPGRWPRRITTSRRHVLSMIWAVPA